MNDSTCHDLPHLEETITSIVVELLLIDKEKRFPHLFMEEPDHKDAARLTMHYVRALLSYGFAPDTPELQHVIDWFDRPFPQKKNDHMDPQEMNRLMVLLLTRPLNENVQSRLEQLAGQRVEYEFDVQPSWGGFDTLWALEIFALALDKKVLRESYIKEAVSACLARPFD